MTKRVAKQKMPNFRVDEVVGIRGYNLTAHISKVIRRSLGEIVYRLEDGLTDWDEVALRPLTARERGGK